MAIFMTKDDDGSVVIWSNPEPGDMYSGRCIAKANTFEDAKRDAIDELRGDLAEVEALSDKDGV
jgi:hypothetical protein